MPIYYNIIMFHTNNYSFLSDFKINDHNLNEKKNISQRNL